MLRVIIARQNEVEFKRLETSQQNGRSLTVCFPLAADLWPVWERTLSDHDSTSCIPIDAVTLTPGKAPNLLIDGNAQYVAGEQRERDFLIARSCRATMQASFAGVLGCAASRVSSELAFDHGPGDLFVVRVAGNLVTDEGLDSLEYGAAALGTKVILALSKNGFTAGLVPGIIALRQPAQGGIEPR